MKRAENNLFTNKRHLLDGIDEGINTNTLQKLSFPPSAFIKVPVNIAETPWKEFRLYVKYLDLKVQNPDLGTFQIFHTERSYQRVIKKMILKGWVTRKKGKVSLKAYQAVWRMMKINRVRVKGMWRYKYWKISTDRFSLDRTQYLKEIEEFIREKITKRKLAQLRFALKDEGEKRQATFSAKSASSLFGYRSKTTGSKLRRKYFELIPQSAEEAKPFFNRVNGRFEQRTKNIAI